MGHTKNESFPGGQTQVSVIDTLAKRSQITVEGTIIEGTQGDKHVVIECQDTPWYAKKGVLSQKPVIFGEESERVRSVEV